MAISRGGAGALVAALALFVLSPPALAQPGAGAAVDPDADARSRMAELHERMAACLRSGRSIDECRTEMRTRCRALMPEGDCPMMGAGGRGMRHGHMGPGMGARRGMGPGTGPGVMRPGLGRGSAPAPDASD